MEYLHLQAIFKIVILSFLAALATGPLLRKQVRKRLTVELQPLKAYWIAATANIVVSVVSIPFLNP